MSIGQAARGFSQGQSATERPSFITNAHLEFLDDLRESGVTNMFGARPYIQEAFTELDDEQSGTVLSYWMKTFGQENR